MDTIDTWIQIVAFCVGCKIMQDSHGNNRRYLYVSFSLPNFFKVIYCATVCTFGLLFLDIPVSIRLTLPLPSLLVPTPFTKEGGGSARPSCCLKNRSPYEREICRILETPLTVLEMLKLFP